jgi:hypothetical protein
MHIRFGMISGQLLPKISQLQMWQWLSMITQMFEKHLSEYVAIGFAFLGICPEITSRFGNDETSFPSTTDTGV